MKIIKTALPLPAQVMVEFFKNKKGVCFEVDYEQSLKNLRTPQAILNYIANLQLKAELVVDKIPKELLAAYSIMRDVVNIESLTRTHGNLLYFCKYGEVIYEDTLERFSYEDIVDYLKDNAESTLIQLALLNSIPLFVATSLGSEPDDDRADHELVSTIDSVIHNEISVNLFQLFKYDTFLVEFLENPVPIEQQIYFKPHFDTNMYGGKTMFGWFAVTGNLYFGLCQHVASKIHNGVDRFELTRLYAGLMALTGDTAGIVRLSNQVSEAGSVAKLLRMSRKDEAEMNRLVRRDKKRAKREVANVHA